MALSLTVRKVLQSEPLSNNAGLFGCMTTTNKALVFGYSDTSGIFPFYNTGYWYNSADDGKNWVYTNTSGGIFGQDSYFGSNIRENVIAIPCYDGTTGTCFIQRSLDFGHTWETTYTNTVSPTPNGRSNFITGIQCYQRTNAVAWGELDGNATNTPKIFAISEDQGATWTLHDAWDVGDYDDVCNAIAITAGGTWYAAYTKFGGVNRQTWLAKTTDYGASWTVLNPIFSSSGTNPLFINAICAFDRDNIVMGGNNAVTPIDSQPGIYWSNNAGGTLNLVNASDIYNWPSGSFYTFVREIKRISRRGCLLAFDQQNGTPGSPWRLSIDAGRTFPIEATLETGAWAPYAIPFGRVLMLPDDRILLPLWESADYDTAYATLYEGKLHC